MRILGILLVLIIAFGGGYFLANPSTCGAKCAENVGQISSISANEFNSQIEAGKAVLIDIRTAEEFDAGHIEGAVNQDFYQTAAFRQYLESLDKDGKYLIYCRSGNRSGQTLALMEEMGFEHVSDLEGGINSWQTAGLTLVK